MRKEKAAKWKYGRPKMAKEDLKEKRIYLRCTGAQFEQLTIRSKAEGIKLSEYCNCRIFDTIKFYTANPSEMFTAFKAVAREMNPIGNNINQLARHANVAYQEGFVDEKLFREMIVLMKMIVEKQDELARLNLNLLKQRND